MTTRAPSDETVAPAPARSFTEKLDDIAQLAGERVRITWPTGGSTVGVITLKDLNGTRHVRIDGTGIGGELAHAVRVERMVGFRYQTADCSKLWGPPRPERTVVNVPPRTRLLDHVRAMFPLGSTVECVHNSLRPELNGGTRRIARLYRSQLRVEVLTGPGAGSDDFYMPLPTRAADVIALDGPTVSFRTGNGIHTMTYRVL